MIRGKGAQNQNLVELNLAVNLSFTYMAPFLTVLVSSASGICILFVQWLGEDVGSGGTVEGRMERSSMSLGLVLQQHLSCFSALLGASGS